MKKNKLFLVFADDHLEEIVFFKKTGMDSVYRMAITKSGIYMKIPMTGSWAKIDGPVCVTMQSLPGDYIRPNFEGSAEFSFHPVNVTEILKADNVTKVE